jgi:predicted O-methyltransferase YrrM
MSGLENKIRFINGDALHIIPTLNMTFDMAYIDADKDHLSEHYQAVMKKMNAGGIIIVDNILWYGKVIDSQQNDRTTQKIRQFNNMIQDDNRVTNVLLPLRDGVMMIKVEN